jgi:hypothetical protein
MRPAPLTLSRVVRGLSGWAVRVTMRRSSRGTACRRSTGVACASRAEESSWRSSGTFPLMPNADTRVRVRATAPVERLRGVRRWLAIGLRNREAARMPWHSERVRRSFLFILLTTGCFEAPCESASEPGGPFVPCAVPAADASVRDAGVDAGRADAGRLDAGLFDAGRPLDAGRPDAGVGDAGVDAGAPAAAVLPTSDGGVRVIDFGTLALGDAGLSAELLVPVEASDEGFQIQVVGLGPDVDAYQVTRLVSPRGVVLASGRDYVLHRSRSKPALNGANTLVLESDDARAEWGPGRWRFVVESWAPGPSTAIEVKVFVKPRPPPGVQRLALNYFFSSSGGLTVATAPTSTRLTQATASFRALMLDAGIALEPPRFFDLPPGFSAVTAGVDEDGGAPMMGRSLQALFRQSAVAPPGMNLFFVESIVLDPRLPPGAVLGVAAGVPGTTMTNGTAGSGVAVLYDAPTYTPRMSEPDPLGVILAHEVGHQLGLSHVFELDGEVDNLTDTPTSGRLADENLMAPFAQDNRVVTPLQAVTLRRNPVVRP